MIFNSLCELWISISFRCININRFGQKRYSSCATFHFLSCHVMSFGPFKKSIQLFKVHLFIEHIEYFEGQSFPLCASMCCYVLVWRRYNILIAKKAISINKLSSIRSKSLFQYMNGILVFCKMEKAENFDAFSIINTHKSCTKYSFYWMNYAHLIGRISFVIAAFFNCKAVNVFSLPCTWMFAMLKIKTMPKFIEFLCLDSHNLRALSSGQWLYKMHGSQWNFLPTGEKKT